MYGYYLPIKFIFTATGGTGVYTWTETQTFIETLNATYTNGSVNQTWDNTDYALQSSFLGPYATYSDSPGVNKNSPWGTVISASWAEDFTLNVSVSSGGQTVNCPTVFWQATETWKTITVNGKSTLVATGQDTYF